MKLQFEYNSELVFLAPPSRWLEHFSLFYLNPTLCFPQSTHQSPELSFELTWAPANTIGKSKLHSTPKLQKPTSNFKLKELKTEKCSNKDEDSTGHKVRQNIQHRSIFSKLKTPQVKLQQGGSEEDVNVYADALFLSLYLGILWRAWEGVTLALTHFYSKWIHIIATLRHGVRSTYLKYCLKKS